MPEYEGRLQARGRLAIVVARYNEVITGKLLDGARQACTEAGYAPDDVDVCWVSGAFEIPPSSPRWPRAAATNSSWPSAR